MLYELKRMLFIAVISISNIYAAPWSNSTREHLFGNPHNATIEDEGFRWRNTFDFNLQNHLGVNLPITNWVFDGVIQWNTPQSPEIFSRPTAVNWQANTSSNMIHRHLANIVHNVNRIHRWKCVSVSAAAVTIVVENPAGVFNAYSKILTNNQNNVYVSAIYEADTTNINLQQHVFSYFSVTDVENLNSFLSSNLPIGYNCTEGRLIYNILQATRLRWNIDQLLTRAGQDGHPETIKLIVLHIGTSMDPCARCTRCLAGLSRRINYGNNTDVLDNPRGLNNFNSINAKFLIEVSSGGHYLTTTAYADNFARYGYGLCSHTECAGHDGQEGAVINIQLRNPGIPIPIPPNPLPQAFVAPAVNGHTVLEYIIPAIHANLFVPVVFAVNAANIAQVNAAAQMLFDQIRVMLAKHITVADVREHLAPILSAFVTAGAVPVGDLANAINAFAANTNQTNAQGILNLLYGGIYNLQPIAAINHQDFANSVMNGLILLADDVAQVAGHDVDRDNMLNTIAALLTTFRNAGFVYPNAAAGATVYATFLSAATAVNAQTLANTLHIGIGPLPVAPGPAQSLFIPNGTHAGWEFDFSFPPYIVLGRTESVPDVIRSPIYNCLISHWCGTIQGAGQNQQHTGKKLKVEGVGNVAARNHNCRVNLPPVN